MYDIAEPKHPMTGAERARRHRAQSPEKAYATKRKYRHDNSKWQTDEHYLAREFVAWDGEGVTDSETGSHTYTLLAFRSFSESDYISDANGLGTSRIFDFVLDHGQRTSGIHIVFGGGYDFNMWLRDFTKTELRSVYTQKYYRWRGFRIGWRKGKSFYIARIDAFGKTKGRGVTIFDVMPFFQCTFVKACDEYLGERFIERELVVKNKALRSTFKDEDAEEVMRYNDVELRNLLALMTELRLRLNKVGLRPRRWDGPGAVASALLMREGVKKAKADCPPEVAKAARFAYAGGRFEVIKFGHVERKAFEYDINSAYPAALRSVPNLSAGRWIHHNRDCGQKTFALYHVESKAYHMHLPAPLFRRNPNGTICYPLLVRGWYWSPEIETLRDYCARGYGEFRISEVWEFIPTEEVSPFAFIEPLYNKRRALKNAKDGAHVGLKLALNSLYGKLAQQVGWEVQRNGTLKIPPFHQLEWAGFTTSYCRANILAACLPKLESVVAFETDAVFTDEPLPVKIGTNLGEFEATEFSSLTYVQSGLYFGTTEGHEVVKSRGIDRGNLTREEVLTAMGHRNAVDRFVETKLTRFVGAGIALAQKFERWQRWETMRKELSVEPTGKRIHLECGACKGDGIALGEWHSTFCPVMHPGHSCEYPIAWINPNPEMSMLEELRDEPLDFE